MSDRDNVSAADSKKKPEKKKGALSRFGSGVGRLTRPKQRFDMPSGESGLRVVIATDAWKPQLNGVVRTLETRARKRVERHRFGDGLSSGR